MPSPRSLALRLLTPALLLIGTPAGATPTGGRGLTFGLDLGAMGQIESRHVTRATFDVDSTGGVFLDLGSTEQSGVVRGGGSVRCQIGVGSPRAWRIQYAATGDIEFSQLGAGGSADRVLSLTTHVLGVELYPQHSGRIPWFVITGLGVGSNARGRNGTALQFGAGLDLRAPWRASLVGQRTRVEDLEVWSARLQIGLHRD